MENRRLSTMTKMNIKKEKNQLENEKVKLLEEIERYRLELSELYNMVSLLKNSYLQEQRKKDANNGNDIINIKKKNLKLEKENKHLQARLRAYRNSKLGKITTWYWNLRKK